MKHVLTIGLTIAVASSAMAPVASSQSADVVTAYMHCVRRNAERLEPAGDSPEDIARAAIFLCQSKEAAAFAASPSSAEELRAAAIFFGAGQAVVARLCRKTKDCGLAPVVDAPNPD